MDSASDLPETIMGLPVVYTENFSHISISDIRLGEFFYPILKPTRVKMVFDGKVKHGTIKWKGDRGKVKWIDNA